MTYSYFYNKNLIGDVLLISIDNELTTTNIKTFDDITLVYHDDILTGINIFNFSSVVKIKNEGRIVLPPNEMIDAINSKLSLISEIKLPYVTETGFKVGKILTVDEHPESSHLHILTVDIGSEVLDIVCGAYNVKENMLVVVATIGTVMMDGTVIKPGKLLGEVSNGMCCSPKELGLKMDYPLHHLLVLDEDKVTIGQDFFSLKQI
jgi:tRNA-binding protein